MLLFNRYEYNPQTDLIGKGGFSRVYRALDKKLNRKVALKVYRITDLPDRYGASEEIQRVINLDHPNICRYLDIEEMEKEDAFGEKERIQVCIMELLDGGNLSNYFHNHQEDPLLFKKLISDVVRGLSYLHKNGVIHRDIKPANILIKETVEGPVAKITDFGISKKSEGVDRNSSSALIVSIPYMAPEQLNAKKYGIDEKISFNLDFWSLGVAIYETLSGDILYRNSPEDTREQIMNNIMSDSLPSKIRRLPQPFLNFVSVCLIKDAKQRVQSAEDLLNILQYGDELLADEPGASEETDFSETSTLVLEKSGSSEETKVLSPADKPTKEPVKTSSIPKTSWSLFERYKYNPQTDLIGKGGFSRVYQAFDKKLDRWVALKIYRPGEFSDLYSPIAEIRRVVNLDHPNICRYLDIEETEKENSFGELERTQICVMELLNGGNFAQYYQSHSSPDILKKLTTDILNGLSYLHKNTIIHRDIKPANILIKETLDGPVAKITDFGISKRSDAVGSNSSSALVVSIPYMAPEQLNAKKYGINEKISFNLDLWSLGVTLYEVITGKILFKNSEQDSPEQIMANIMAPEMPERISELPEPFKTVVAHCLVKDANQRAQKAEELIVLLHRNLDTAKATVAEKPLQVVTAEHPREAEKRPEEVTEKIAKPSFFIEKPEEIPQKTQPKPYSPLRLAPNHLVTYLRIAVVVAILAIGVILFFQFKGSKKADLVSAPGKQPDSVHIENQPVSSGQSQTSVAKEQRPPVTSPDSAMKEPTTALTKRDTSSNKSTESPVDHSKTSVPNSHKAVNQTYILELSTPEDCTVKINDVDYGKLAVGQSMKVYLKVGTYVIQAASATNNSKSYSGSLQVYEKQMNHSGQFRIPFK